METADFDQLLADARKRVQDTKESGPSQIKSEGYLAEKSIVRLRDYLIERSREHGDAEANVKESLKKVNTALSLTVGLEFPLSSLKKKLVDDALKILDQIKAA